MLRTTILEEFTEQRWTLQGRLSGPWVAYLKTDWQKSHCRGGKRKCVVDVSGVTFVDLEGERVLAAMMNDGAEFIATGVYTKHVLEETERKHILSVLAQTKWVVAGPKGAATRLGMKRSTLQLRIRKLGLSRENAQPVA